MDIGRTQSDYIDAVYVDSIIGKRPREMHKGECGRVLVVAGSEGMTGAAVFTARAALRCGSGLVYICTPRVNFQVMQILVPEAICVEWDDARAILGGEPDRSGRHVDMYDAVAVGPGMGAGPGVKEKLDTILRIYHGKVVIDADGLNQISRDPETARLVRDFDGEIVLTPHTGEAARLLSGFEDVPRYPKKREDAVTELVRHYECVALLKGSETLVSSAIEAGEAGENGSKADLLIRRNTTGNPGMATAGSGDVLTGVIASLAGQGLRVMDAAAAGAFIHGMAGDEAAARLGEYSVIASDIVDYLPDALKRFTMDPGYHFV